MTRLEELTTNLADDALTDEEAGELQALLDGSERGRQVHLRILRIEAGLRGQRKNLELTAAVMTRLRTHVTESVAQGVMTQIKTQPAPEWVRPRVLAPEAAKPASRRLLFPFFAGWSGWSLKHAWLPLAACLVAAAGLGIWFFGFTMGQPALAGVQGSGLSIVRAGQALSGVAGMRLQTADVLRTPTNVTAIIGFSPETTLVTLQPGTELILAGMSRGKRFDLRLGKLEAFVARQRPLRPMEITTPQAEARVVGTRFTLAVTTNATRLDVTEGQVRLTRAADGSSVRVPGDHYAVVANATVMAALPHTGGLLREWWGNVVGKTRFALREDPRFPDRPESRDNIHDFELKLSETNRLGLRLRGYLHPPATGQYEFFLEYSLPGSSYAGVTMSPNENPADGVGIASTGRTGIGATQAPPPVPLVAGRRYYIEAQVLINSKGEGHLALEWKPPKGSRKLITSEFLSPFKTK